VWPRKNTQEVLQILEITPVISALLKSFESSFPVQALNRYHYWQLIRRRSAAVAVAEIIKTSQTF